VSVNAIALAGIVFLFALIPTIGTILGASIVALFSLFASPTLAIVMIVYFILYQQIENATIQPLIQSRGNELTPMLVFIAAVMGIGLGGVLGGFLAIPIAGCAKVLFDDWIDDLETSKQDS
jgi:predicted PurR-regulated permease PerM